MTTGSWAAEADDQEEVKSEQTPDDKPHPDELSDAAGFYCSLNNKGRKNTFGVKFTATFIKPNWLRH